MAQTEKPVTRILVEQTNPSPHAENSTLFNLYLLGRLPFTLEATLWCILGSIIFHAQHGTMNFSTMSITATLVCLTNLSINYANEYFDFEADSILASKADSHGGTKMLVNGTFPRIVALYCAASVQALIILIILAERFFFPEESCLKGFVLWFGLGSMIAAQQYVGPPLRLHYNGGGEIVSSFQLSAAPVLFGFTAQMTSQLGYGLSLHEVWDSLSRDMVLFLAWAYLYQLARIFMMHAADIEEDKAAGKHTLVSMVGYQQTKRLYQFATALHVLLAWKLVLANQKALYLMLPVMTVALPIAFKVQKAMDHLIKDGEVGRKEFAFVPTLVSVQTMLTPALFIIITLVVGNCLG